MRTLKFYFLPLLCIELVHAQAPKLYINFVSHNEENYVHYVNFPTQFYQVRVQMKNFATECQNKGAVWHLGTDYMFLKAISRYDTGSVQSNTNSKNIIRFLHEDLDVVIDAHAHENDYAYADVAGWISSLGVTPSPVVSGHLYNQLQNGHSWEDFETGVTSDSFPSFTWVPDVLWGAGTPGHVSDPDYYGIWRPQDMSNYLVHDPSRRLMTYGQGCSLKVYDTTHVTYVMAAIRETVQGLQDGSAPTDGIYPTSIFFQENYLNTPGFVSKLADLIDSVNVLVSAGSVEWMRIDSVAYLWESAHGTDGFYAQCGWSAFLGEESLEQDMVMYPNPSHDEVMLQWDAGWAGEVTVRIWDNCGRMVYCSAVQDTYRLRLSVKGWIPGIYPVQISGSNGTVMQKLVVY